MAFRTSLLDLDPDLARALPAGRASLAQEQLHVRLEPIPAGTWRLATDGLAMPGAIGLLVVSGLAVRRVTLEHRASAELLGPGDLIRPWEEQAESIAYPMETTWRVVEPLELAVLDATLATRLAAFPEVLGELMGRAVLRSYRLGGALVVAQLTSVDDRLLVALWHLAEQWGRVRRDGVLVGLRLTHELLGLVVGARRPSVTAALGRLADEGLVMPQPTGGWLLAGEPPQTLRRTRRANARPLVVPKDR